MNDRSPEDFDLTEVRRGLQMTTPPDPTALETERRHLASLEGEGFFGRVRGYWRLVGPGYMQSAMTLGGGSASAALFAGAAFGYRLLWVAPVAMLLGIVMLSAVAHQTLSTGKRPFDAMRRYAGGFFAWGWAIGALIASIIWHFPQYALAAAVLGDMGEAASLPSWPPLVWSFIVLGWAVAISFLYGRSTATIRIYERILKFMVWAIIACFAGVVVKTGISDWGALFRGFFAFEIPDDGGGRTVTIILGGLAAAVGINMVFLYPYSLLARGWGREHRGLARFDLGAGMFLPYVLATSLMTIATANTIYPFEGTGLSPGDAGQTLAGFVGPTTGRLVFNLGVLGMALSTITLHMVACGFVACEVFGFEVGSRRHRLAMLLPTPGVLGPVVWAGKPLWLSVVTSVLCGFLLPVAYFGFLRLQTRRDYLGKDRPTGPRGTIHLVAMAAFTVFLLGFLVWYAAKKLPGLF